MMRGGSNYVRLAAAAMLAIVVAYLLWKKHG
ncbi:hypothetical protein FHW69_000656 [Luteibacter sp. Sphag1AF]|nr:hypothetical protein [Luteibacter sp. Sphag1AF]